MTYLYIALCSITLAFLICSLIEERKHARQLARIRAYRMMTVNDYKRIVR